MISSSLKKSFKESNWIRVIFIRTLKTNSYYQVQTYGGGGRRRGFKPGEYFFNVHQRSLGKVSLKSVYIFRFPRVFEKKKSRSGPDYYTRIIIIIIDFI